MTNLAEKVKDFSLYTIEYTAVQNMQHHIGKADIEVHVDPAFTVINFLLS